MARVLITGSTDGLGRAAAASLLDDGHQVVVHARSQTRLTAIRDLPDRGARSVVGDLGDLGQVSSLADQANELGSFDAVIHNAGVIGGPSLMCVNVVAPYVLTALIPATRAIYLSSSMHRGGRADVSTVSWSDRKGGRYYSDSKLLVTVLMAAIARRSPALLLNAVDPGWVPTRMGGPSASDRVHLGLVTQAWLAVSNDPDAQVSGKYWFHRRTEEPHPAVHDEAAQGALLSSLAEYTGVHL